MSNNAQHHMNSSALQHIKLSLSNNAQPQMKGNAQQHTINNAQQQTSRFAQLPTKLYAPEENLMEEVVPIDGNEAHGFSIKAEEEVKGMVDVENNLGINVSRFRRTRVDLYQSSIAKEFQGNLVTMYRNKRVIL